MTRLVNFLSRTGVLIVTGVAMVALLIILSRLREATGGTSLDFLLTSADAIAYLEHLKTLPGGVETHRLMTGVFDMAFPLAYGGFVAGLCGRYGGKQGVLLALPILLGVAFDFGENLVQIAGLSGYSDVLHAKTVLTPVKFGFVLLGFVIAFVLWARAVIGGLMTR